MKSGEVEIFPAGKDHLNVHHANRFRRGDFQLIYAPMLSSKDNRVIGVIEAGRRKTYWQFIYDRDVPILRGFADYAVRALEYGERDLLERINHEFTAPISGIRNNTSLLLHRFRERSEHFIQTKLEDILADCQMVLNQVGMLERVLIRRPTANEKTLTLVVRDIIAKTINELKPIARAKKFNPAWIRYRNEDIPKINIYVDRIKLNQVVYNLLTNAIKYSGNNPSSFNITICVDETEDTFIIKFRDWGIGIEPGCEKQIFESGFRAPHAISHHISGSGLGLTIARDNAREIGGDLLLKQNRQPTEFHLLLPKSLKEKRDE